MSTPSTKADLSTACSISASVTATNNNHNCNGNNNSTEQPQTKRQKIEKIKTNVKSSIVTKAASATTTKTCESPPPDIIDTGGVNLFQSSPSSKLISNDNQQQIRFSSLSSSDHSISTPSTSNNSPTSTPASSRTTSLSYLLNVQGTDAHILPGNAGITSSTNTDTRSTSALHNIIDCATSSSSSAASSSVDEVDRITLKPNLLSSKGNICRAKFPVAQTTQEQETAVDAALALAAAHSEDMREFEASLNRQCLCGVSERTLRKPFQSHYSLDANGQKRIANLSEWPTEKLLQFLSNLQLLFDIYLKQNSKGFICARIMDVCDVLIRNDHNLIDEIIVLAGYSNAYVQFLAARVLASFLVIAKQELDDNWLKKLVDNLFNFDRLDRTSVQKMHFSLEIIKRIVEWKDMDLHPLEDEIVGSQGSSGGSDDPSSSAALSNASGSGETDTFIAHRFFNFQPQHPTLETNYFALQFRGAHGGAIHHDEEEDGDEDEIEEVDGDDDLDDDVLEESMVHAHARRHHHAISHMSIQQQHHNRQQHQHFSPYDLHRSASMSNNNDYLASIPYEQASMHSAAHYTTPHPHHYNQQQSIGHPHDHHSHAHAYDTLAAHYSNSSNAAVFNVDINSAPSTSSTAVSASLLPSGCHIITLTDSESFDTSHLKGVTIKILENKWPALVKNMSALIVSHMHIDHAEHCILNFLQLWENIISVKANLSVVETRPFYAQLDRFELLLQQQQLTCTVYKQLLCLFNEALCYGSTLALQDMLPVETCRLAQKIVRHVKEARILDSLPRRQPENLVSFLGFKRAAVIYKADGQHALSQEQNAARTHTLLSQHYDINNSTPCTGATPSTSSIPQAQAYATQSESYALLSTAPTEVDGNTLEMDKTILQKMVLLVLKSVAVTVKEIRSDSSDSSIDSHDCDAYQDMVLIERSIRDVLRRLESFIKHKLEFHPESHFSKILIHLFDDQDDHLIEAMVCTLDVTAGISFRNNAFPELVTMLNPVFTFLEFLKMISNSSDLLLDLLVSNETCFLLYLLRFLKYIRANWEMFLRSCHEFGMGASSLDDAMSVLIRLRLHISRLVARQLYPYDISPVLRLLESCEGLYEGNERSLT